MTLTGEGLLQSLIQGDLLFQPLTRDPSPSASCHGDLLSVIAQKNTSSTTRQRNLSQPPVTKILFHPLVSHILPVTDPSVPSSPGMLTRETYPHHWTERVILQYLSAETSNASTIGHWENASLDELRFINQWNDCHQYLGISCHNFSSPFHYWNILSVRDESLYEIFWKP